MEEVISNLEDWFTQRPSWLQDATRRIIQKGAIEANDLNELVRLCKQEAGITDPDAPQLRLQAVPEGALKVNGNSTTLCFEEISDVKGINALSPRSPLKLSEGPLTIIYGGTGSGKSGYVRILKHACGAKSPGNLYGNVFDAPDAGKGCTFKVKIGEESKELSWSPEAGVMEDIKTTEIYDTDCATVYLTEDNEVAYEPWILSLFSQLTDVCKQVDQKIKDEIDLSVSVAPSLPINLHGVVSASWYSNLDHQITQEDIDKRCFWDEKLDGELTALNKRLAEPDPTKQAAKLRRTKTNLTTLHDELKNIRDQLSDEQCTQYLKAKGEAALKRKTADEDAKKVFENAPLDGVGEESWRLLWDQARAYSEASAYPGVTFPNVSEEARCVLCQQILQAKAVERFESFESFVKGELQKQASEAEEKFQTISADIEEIISDETIKLRMDSADISDEDERTEISDFHSSVVDRKNSLLKASTIADISALPEETLIDSLKGRCDKMEEQAQAYDQDAKGQDRAKLELEAKELETRKWLSEQKKLIEKEVERLKQINLLEAARRLTSTQGLSVKKSHLAEELITSAFIERFKNELGVLGASRINVELVKSRAEYGRVYHKFQLENCIGDICTTDILSEGEFRIVSIAAFLADMEGQDHVAPFIFDDPISSLDQDFEESTARRLIELCASRQVIVFTHRLSLLALLEDAAKKADIEPYVICLRSESWGTGEPGETPIFAKKPRNALNTILNERLPRARKILEEQGQAEYDLLAKGICGDIRILIERLIEIELLADVVQRFRRSVQTMGKLHKLANINVDDCKLLDDYMTKYSKYEHSQPAETPEQMPNPDEIETDINLIAGWLDEFKNR
jgi:energy-coupling factor transporter ATP-binding protein EcfA2